MKIPKRFKLFGHIVTVVFDKTLDGKYGNTGEARYTDNSIALMPNIEGVFQRNESQVQQVFCHELIHHILHQMHETELRGNEKFVDQFGSLLHQALTTMEYE